MEAQAQEEMPPVQLMTVSAEVGLLPLVLAERQ